MNIEVGDVVYFEQLGKPRCMTVRKVIDTGNELFYEGTLDGYEYCVHHNDLGSGDRNLSELRKIVDAAPSPWRHRRPTIAFTETQIARSLFCTMSEVTAFVATVSEGRKPESDWYKRVWDRDENGWRTQCEQRARKMALESQHGGPF